MSHQRMRFAITALGLAALAACGGLLGGGEPAELHRFGDLPPPALEASTASVEQPILVAFHGANFQAESGGDRILTVTGTSVAYIANARWVTAANELFDGQVLRALDRLRDVRVIRPGGMVRPDLVLAIDVRRFEAVYAGAQGPEVVIEASVRLARQSDRASIGERRLSIRQPASENRVAAIVAAFDGATAQATSQITELIGQSLGQVQAPPGATPSP